MKKSEKQLIAEFEAKFGKIVNGKHDGNLYLGRYAHPLPATFTGCGGYLYLGGYAHPLPATFTGCGGYLYLRDYAHPLPATFTGCGGNLYLGGYAHPLPKKFKENNGYKFNPILSILNGKYICADGIFAEVIQKRGNVYTLKKFAQSEIFYLVTDGKNTHAHGDTLKKTKEDFRFKIMAETLKKEPIKPDTLITVNHYRLLTGSCEMGVRNWMEQNGLKDKEKIKAKDLLPILERTGAYGLEKFRQLITF